MQLIIPLSNNQEAEIPIEPTDTLQTLLEKTFKLLEILPQNQRWYENKRKLVDPNMLLSNVELAHLNLLAQPITEELLVAHEPDPASSVPFFSQMRIIEFVNDAWSIISPLVKQDEKTCDQLAKVLKSYMAEKAYTPPGEIAPFLQRLTPTEEQFTQWIEKDAANDDVREEKKTELKFFHFKILSEAVGVIEKGEPVLKKPRYNPEGASTPNPTVTTHTSTTTTTTTSSSPSISPSFLNTLNRPVSRKLFPDEEPKYIFLGQGGVLDGIYSELPGGDSDLELTSYSEGGWQILQNGVEIVKILNELQELNYQIVFHSKNSEEDQLNFLNSFEKACQAKNLSLPTFIAMGIYDKKNHGNFSSNQPFVVRSSQITKIYWGNDDEDGKASLRRALESALAIRPDTREQHIVFDDGPTVTEAAAKEGYQIELIDQPDSFYQKLKVLINNVKTYSTGNADRKRKFT